MSQSFNVRCLPGRSQRWRSRIAGLFGAQDGPQHSAMLSDHNSITWPGRSDDVFDLRVDGSEATSPGRCVSYVVAVAELFCCSPPGRKVVHPAAACGSEAPANCRTNAFEIARSGPGPRVSPRDGGGWPQLLGPWAEFLILIIRSRWSWLGGPLHARCREEHVRALISRLLKTTECWSCIIKAAPRPLSGRSADCLRDP